MRIVGWLAAGAVAAACAFPASLAAQEKATAPVPDVVKLENARGTVTFAHGKHSKMTECTTCHHASKPEKPLTAERQKCTDCHTSPVAEPMKTSLRAAMHNPAEKTGICFDCHVKAAAAGKTTPSKCSDCHVKAEGTD